MHRSRGFVVLMVVGVGVALGACSSSKATGPSTAKLAATLDSLFHADSAAGSSRVFFDELTLIGLDEGASVTKASITTDGAALSMDLSGVRRSSRRRRPAPT